MITQTDVRVNVALEMSLTEALELETRLAGGRGTEATESLRLAVQRQLLAAEDTINFNARAS